MKLWLRRHEWTLVGCTAVAAFLCGVFGMRWQMAAEGLPVVWGDAAYFSLRLFVFEYDLGGDGQPPYGPHNWLLQVTRFVAPASLAYAVVKGVMLAVAYRFNLWQISRWKGHAVICGGGERGRQLAVSLRHEGQRVVVIEKDANAEALADIRASGARVVIGSGTDPARQAEARLEHAGILIAVTPCEKSNLQVVLAASRRRPGRPLRALAHACRSFAEMFETRPPFSGIIDGQECSFFDHDVAASRLLVAEYAPTLVRDLLGASRAPRLLLAGNGDVLPELLGVIVTQFQFATAAVPLIDLLVIDEDGFTRHFPLHHPQLSLVADLTVHPMPLTQMLAIDLATLRDDLQERPYDFAFAACREDIDTLTLARNLSQQPACLKRDVVAGLRPSTQISRLFIDEQPLAGVQSHDLVALGCSSEIVLHGRIDEVARSLHEADPATQVAAGQPMASARALVSWNALPDSLRQANRSQADHIPIKQQTLSLSSTPETIEALAEAEHRRWMAEKIVANWRFSATRDDTRRLHPSIVAYKDLTEEEKQKDRDTVAAAMRDRRSLAGRSRPG